MDLRGGAIVVAAAITLIGAYAGPTHAQTQVPDCDGATPSVLAFSGLPDAVTIGALEPFGLDETGDSEANAPGTIKIRMLDRRGKAFFTDALDPDARGGDLLYLRLDLGDVRVKIEARYIEQSADGSECRRVLTQRVRERRRIYFPSRCFNPGIRPSSVIIACGDGNFQLRRMRWRGWHRRVASGRGQALVNDCIPYCAAGRFHRIGVRVKLSKPRLCKNVAQYVYARISWRFSSRPPGGGRRSGRVGFPCSFYDDF